VLGITIAVSVDIPIVFAHYTFIGLSVAVIIFAVADFGSGKDLTYAFPGHVPSATGKAISTLAHEQRTVGAVVANRRAVKFREDAFAGERHALVDRAKIAVVTRL